MVRTVNGKLPSEMSDADIATAFPVSPAPAPAKHVRDMNAEEYEEALRKATGRPPRRWNNRDRLRDRPKKILHLPLQKHARDMTSTERDTFMRELIRSNELSRK